MAGRGPQPKDPSKRARRNKAPELKIIPAVASAQPSLPVIEHVTVDENGTKHKERFHWPAITRRWWKMWAESPLSVDYTDVDWAFLLDTAYIHALYWKGDVKQAAELRLRVAKFGATPEDRARLRIQFAVADAVEDDPGAAAQVATGVPSSSRERSRSRSIRVVGDE